MKRGGGLLRTGSIKRALLQVLVIGTFVPAALIWAVGHWTAQSAVTELWDGLSHRISDLAAERTLRYLETGATALEVNDAAVRDGRVDPARREDLLRFLLAGLRANPNVTWYSFAGADGSYLSAYWYPGGGLRLTWREQEEGGTRYRDFVVRDDGGLEALPEVVKSYDPRTREWFQLTLEADSAVWSKPFIFASGPPGFILSRALRDEDGGLIGVWGIEYEMSYVSDFLQHLEVGQSGRAYLATAIGEVIGHPEACAACGRPDGWIVREVDGKRVIATAKDHRDPWLATAFDVAGGRGAGEQHFDFECDGETYLAAWNPFPKETQLPWGILVVIPEDDILGTIQRNSTYAALLAAMIALVVLVGGLLYARVRLTGPLEDITKDLDGMARLETDESPRVEGSHLTEIEGMVRARERMRGGLRSFMKYVPAQLVRDLFAAGAEARLGGEKRRITVLFSDVADFTSVSEEVGDPERLVGLLESYFRAMSASIAGHRGTVDKYIGDAVMAFWGAPKEIENPAHAACRAAWTCQRKLAELRTAWAEAGTPPFHTRIGVNTGDAVVGNIGWAERMNYTAMGDAVNIASRLEGLCSLYGTEIAISEETWGEVEDEFLARPLDFVSVKGRTEPLVVYELLGPRSEASEAEQAFAALVTKGFDLYRERAFVEAQRLFEEAALKRPDDVACGNLAVRCARYAEFPPPDDWTGAVKLDRKS